MNICCLVLTLVSSFMLLRGSSQAGSPPTEFLNIPWKAAPAEARRIMAQREAVTFKEETPERIVYQGGVFATHPVEHWEIEFPGGQFRRATVYVVIPPGNGKDGVPLRNHQFEDYNKSFTEKYGKGTRFGDGKHTQCTWTWTVPDPRSGQKDTVSILLSYSWEPYEFKIQYSSQPQTSSDKPAFGKPVKKGDL